VPNGKNRGITDIDPIKRARQVVKNTKGSQIAPKSGYAPKWPWRRFALAFLMRAV